jgi:hypothetical protein
VTQTLLHTGRLSGLLGHHQERKDQSADGILFSAEIPPSIEY